MVLLIFVCSKQFLLFHQYSLSEEHRVGALILYIKSSPYFGLSEVGLLYVKEGVLQGQLLLKDE